MPVLRKLNSFSRIQWRTVRHTLTALILVRSLFACQPHSQSVDHVTTSQTPATVHSVVLETVSPHSRVDFTDPLFSRQWYFSNTGQTSAQGKAGVPQADIRFSLVNRPTNTKDPVVIAVIDSGYDHQHPDLDREKIFINPGEQGFDSSGAAKETNGIDDDNNGYIDDISGWNFADANNTLSDALGHGTHTIGLLAAKSNNQLGISAHWSGIRVLPVQIFSGKRPSPDADKIARAIRYAVDMGAQVISASFGTPTPMKEMELALNYAKEHDVIVVSAVGNFRKNNDHEPSFPAGYQFSNQISVGALERRGLPAAFTNFGHSVDLLAPGEDILSLATNSEYVSRSGTSQACPLVSAAVALARAQFPDDSAELIKNRVLRAADERIGLQGFSATGRSLNVDNIILNRDGARLQRWDFSIWQSEPVLIESEHPYRSKSFTTQTIKAPAGTRHFRLHFRRFTTQSTDTLEVIDSSGHVVALFSGDLGEQWSPVLDGDGATLRFNSDEFVSDYGWLIDRIEYLR